MSETETSLVKFVFLDVVGFTEEQCMGWYLEGV